MRSFYSIWGLGIILLSQFGAAESFAAKTHIKKSTQTEESLAMPEVDLYRGNKRLRFAKKGEFFVVRECPQNKDIKSIDDCDAKTETLIRQDIFKEKVEYELLMSQIRRRKAENKEFNAEELALLGRNLKTEIEKKTTDLNNYKAQLESFESIENPSADKQEEILRQKELIQKTKNELDQLEKQRKPWEKLKEKLREHDSSDVAASKSHFRKLERAILDSDVEKTFEFHRSTVPEIYEAGTGVTEEARNEKIFAKVLADVQEMPPVPCGNDSGTLEDTLAACANRLGEKATRNVKVNGKVITWKLARIDLKGNQFWFDEAGGVVWQEPTSRFSDPGNSMGNSDCLKLNRFRISDPEQAQKAIAAGIEKAIPKIFPGEAFWVSQTPLEADPNKQFSFGKYSMFVGGSDGGKTGIYETRGGVDSGALIRLRHLCARNMTVSETW